MYVVWVVVVVMMVMAMMVVVVEQPPADVFNPIHSNSIAPYSCTLPCVLTYPISTSGLLCFSICCDGKSVRHSAASKDARTASKYGFNVAAIFKIRIEIYRCKLIR